MKKNISILIALVMVLTIGLSVLAACIPGEKTVVSIEVVDAKTTYQVGDSIDYDNLQVKVTYDDKTTETKTVKAWSARVEVEADLSKAGSTYYKITFSGKECMINVTVSEEPVVIENVVLTSYRAPAFYSNYVTNSKDREDGQEETRADFRSTGRIYEVGNANKFVFRPTGAAYDSEKDDTVDINNVKTKAKVYVLNTTTQKYDELTGDALTDFVTIDDNTYKFSEDAADAIVKLEIAIDVDAYDIDEDQIKESDSVIVAELKVIDGGYNVYNQLGLSAMADLQKQAWADIWGATATWNSATKEFDLTAKQGATPLKLEADENPLYTYVGNISTVILHASFTLDANQFPASYFWTEQTEGYKSALDSLEGLDEMKERLVGSLVDGLNNDMAYRNVDIDPDTDVVVGADFYINAQKGLYSTLKVSVSGNYNSIVLPTEEVKNGRNFYTVVDNSNVSSAANPYTYYAVFQMHQPHSNGVDVPSFSIRNLSMGGNCPKQQISDTDKGTPAGMMMVNTFSIDFTLDNVVGDKFYTNIIFDSYGEGATGGKFADSKLYDSYSNMFYAWLSDVQVTNCEFIGAGGPLFLLVDGSNFTLGNNNSDANGSTVVVDDESVLESPAEGSESWYAINDATILVNTVKTLDPIFKAMGKTILTKTETTTEGKKREFLNIVAAITCFPADLKTGLTNSKLDVCGSYTTKSGNTVVEEFKMHNTLLTTIQYVKNGNANEYPIIFQLGENFAFYPGSGTDLYTIDQSGMRTLTPQELYAWQQDEHTKLAVYLSTGPLPIGTENSPYFGVILEIAPLAQA